MDIVLSYVVFMFSYLVVDCSTKQKCVQPVLPIYGNYKEQRTDYIPNDTISYSCTDKTFLYGSKIRMCLNNGTWNASTPYCATTVVRQISNEKGQILRNVTDGDYSSCVPYSHPMKLTFRYNGKRSQEGILRFVWKATERQNHDKHIDGILSCKNLGRYRTDSFDFNEYKCSLKIDKNNTFSIPAVKQRRELCEVEIFTEKDDVCLKLPIDNGYVHYDPSSSTPVYGNAAVITCNDGYKISGEGKLKKDVLYCSDGGQWLGGNSSCEIVRCKTLSKVKNGDIVYRNQTYRGLAKLHCEEGYMPTMNTEVTCQSDGNWAEHDFKCGLIDCGNKSDVRNGKIRYSNTTLDGIAILQCNIGYHVMQESNSTCLKNGSWSYSNFECKQILCYKLPKPKNGVVWLQENENLDNATVGTKARLQCQPGFTKTPGKLYIECLANGKWSATNVTCKSATLPRRKIVVIAATIGAISSAFVFTCFFICGVLLRRRLKRRQLPDTCLPFKETVERRISSERHEYGVIVYEEIQDVWKKKPTSPLPKIPSDEVEFNYSLPIDQRKNPYSYSGSDYNYMEPDDAFKTESSSVQTRSSLKRRNSSADSTYWRGNDDVLGGIYLSDVPKMRKTGSNTSLPDFPANKFSVFENDLYSSD